MPLADGYLPAVYQARPAKILKGFCCGKHMSRVWCCWRTATCPPCTRRALPGVLD